MPVTAFMKCTKKREKEFGEEKFNLTFIGNTGRCGSTLLASSLEAKTDAIVIDEPIPIRDWLPDKTVTSYQGYLRLEVLKAVIDVLCLQCTKESGTRNVVIKTISHGIAIIQDLHTLYPDSKKIYMYRNPTKHLPSMEAAYKGMYPNDMIFKFKHRFITDRRDIITFNFYDPNGPASKTLEKNYLTNIKKDYIVWTASKFAANVLSAIEMENRGIQFYVVCFDEFVKNFQKIFLELTSHCGYEVKDGDSWELTKQDTQKNTFLGKSNLDKLKQDMTDAKIKCSNQVFNFCGLPDCDKFPLRNVKSLRDITCAPAA